MVGLIASQLNSVKALCGQICLWELHQIFAIPVYHGYRHRAQRQLVHLTIAVLHQQ